MQYYTEAGRLMALEDLLSRFEHLHLALAASAGDSYGARK